MFKVTTLRARFIASFVLMGLIVLVVSFVGWNGNERLTVHINTFNKNALPSANCLWKINEGQTQIQSAERRLFDPRLGTDEREESLNQIKNAWAQIDAGFQECEATPANDEIEEQQHQKFKQSWDAWTQAHQKFMAIEEEFNEMNIRNPWERQTELLSQGKKENSPEMTAVKSALALYEQMDIQQTKREEPLFKVADEEAFALLQLNNELAKQTQKKVEEDVIQTTFWAILGMAIGPVTAAIFGIYFTNTIAKPLETQVQQSGLKITSSTTQIAASGKQLEAMMTEQVASTNEVVATAKEIATTSGQLVKTMDEVTEMAANTTTAAGSGQKDIQRMETTMRQLAEATSSIAGKLGVISEKANNINGVIITITQVADRTNLLSLNAAIEAEKAGEYGLGFAVVAREIRRLADQTAVSTLDIEQIVKEMQSAVSTGVMEMDKFTKEVGRSVEDVRSLSGQLAEIIEQVRALTPRFEEVNQGMESQSIGAQQISEAMIQLSEASAQTADSLREINGAIAQLNEAAQGLRREILALK